MYGPRKIRDLRHQSKSSVNLSSPSFIPTDEHSHNFLMVPVQRGLRAARSAENLTSHQHDRPPPSTPHHAPETPHHTPGTPPKPPSRFNSPRPSLSSSYNDNWSGQLLINKLSPRPSVTSLGTVTLGGSEYLGDDIEAYIQSQRRLTVGVILLAGIMLVFMVLISIGLFWFATHEIPRNRMVAAHMVINSTALKLEQKRVTEQPMIVDRRTSCEKGTELLPWITDKGVTTLSGIIFNSTTNRLVIADSGHYFVYSQVVFDKVGNRTQNDPISNSLYHVMCKSSHNRKPKDLLQATETPNKVIDWTDKTVLAFHTSHISGVVPLLKGDEIYVKVSNLDLVQLVGNAKTIFTGLFRLPTAGADPGV